MPSRQRRKGERTWTGRGALSLWQAMERAKRLLRQRLRIASPEQYNERIVYLEAIPQALAVAGGMSFVSVFLVRLGAPSWLVGLYTSLPALITTLFVLPAGVFVQRQRSLVATLSWARIIFRGTFAAFALMPFLPLSLAPYVLVAMRSLISIPGAVLNVSVTTLWGSVTTPRRRPRMLSMRLAVQGIIAAGVGLLSGAWLDRVPFPLNYQVLFATVLLGGLGSVAALSRLRMRGERNLAPVAQRTGSLANVSALVRDTPGFRNYTLAALVFRLGMHVPMALFPIMRVRELGATDGWIGILLTVQRVLSVFSYFAVGALASRPKYRRWLWVSCIGIGFFPLTMSLATNTRMLLIPEIFGGIFGAGMNIFLTDTLFRVCPEDNRPSFVAANSFMASLMGFIGPLLGTFLSELIGIRTTLALGGLLRMVGGLVFWRLGVGTDAQRSSPASAKAA